VLGAFFGRHAHMASDLHLAFGGLPQQDSRDASDKASDAEPRLPPNDSASSLLAGCTGNIVPLPQQRLHGGQLSHNAAPPLGAMLAGSGGGGPHSTLAFLGSEQPLLNGFPLQNHQALQRRRMQAQRNCVQELHAMAEGAQFLPYPKLLSGRSAGAELQITMRSSVNCRMGIQEMHAASETYLKQNHSI
jgi:hypothetical protein